MTTTRINTFTAHNDKAHQLLEFLESLRPYISNSKGCISCEILKHLDKPNQFVVLEKWRSIDDHKHSVESFPADKMHGVMALMSEPPSGDYYT